MTIKVYNNHSDDKTFPKELEEIRTITGTMRGALDSLIPNFTLETSFPLNFDYIYVQELNRYYYITDSVCPNTGLVNIQCMCDVLQSFYTQFINSPCIVSRNNSMFNSYIKDDRRRFYQFTKSQYITLGELHVPDCAVLIAVG